MNRWLGLVRARFSRVKEFKESFALRVTRVSAGIILPPGHGNERGIFPTYG